MTNFDQLQQSVLAWAEARGILKNGKAPVQLMKLGSELGELFDAEIKNDMLGIIDGVGDCLVVLIIYSHLRGLSLDECLTAAYDEIKDRKGYLTADGLFVKEAV